MTFIACLSWYVMVVHAKILPKPNNSNLMSKIPSPHTMLGTF